MVSEPGLLLGALLLGPEDVSPESSSFWPLGPLRNPAGGLFFGPDGRSRLPR
jgi:hypothetical protein